jgi:hypothetical protein
MKPHLPKRKALHQVIIPRRAVPLTWAILVFAIQILLPWIIAKLGPRFGWSGSVPGNWNFVGLIAVAIGLA